MNGWLYTAIMLVTVGAIWSFESVRALLSTEVYSSFDRFLERWLSPVLAVLVIGCIYLGAQLPQTPASPLPIAPIASDPSPARQIDKLAPSERVELLAGPQGLEGGARPIVAEFRVVERTAKDGVVVIPGAEARVGNEEARGDANGVVMLVATSRPTDNASVRVSHKDYVLRFERFGDVAEGRDVIMQRKMRIMTIAIPAQKGADEQALDLMRSQFETAFLRDGIEQLSNERDRNDIVAQLYRFSEARALYDVKTLQRVGEFHGASHGVFLTLTPDPNGLRATARLVDFRTSQVVQIVEILAADGKDLNVGHALAEQLLADIAELEILSPRDDTVCGRQVSLEGFARFLPEDWRMWISVQPVGNALHFPQLPVTLQTDGWWLASAVSLGAAVQQQPKQGFKVYILLTDSQRSAAIDAYLAGARTGHNPGVNLNQWERQSYRLLNNITIVRAATANECQG